MGKTTKQTTSPIDLEKIDVNIDKNVDRGMDIFKVNNGAYPMDQKSIPFSREIPGDTPYRSVPGSNTH